MPTPAAITRASITSASSLNSSTHSHCVVLLFVSPTAALRLRSRATAKLVVVSWKGGPSRVVEAGKVPKTLGDVMYVFHKPAV